MRMVRVLSFPGTINFGGEKYGPSAGPLDIPEELANALGLSGDAAEITLPVSEEVREAHAERDAAREDLAELLALLRPQALPDESPDALVRRVLSELRTYKGFSNDSERVLNRYVGETGANEGGLDVLRRLTGELDRLRDTGGDTAKLESDLQASRELQARAEAAGRDNLAEISSLKGDVARLGEEKAALEARPFLPEDARKRLIALPKIGEKAADEVLAALGFPPAPVEGK